MAQLIEFLVHGCPSELRSSGPVGCSLASRSTISFALGVREMIR
jgi:hypothetical protein